MVTTKYVKSRNVYKTKFNFPEDAEISQEYLDNIDIDKVFHIISLTDLMDCKKFITDKCNELEASLNLTQGDIVRVAYFKGNGKDFLFFTAHHLAVDGISWRIILEDLNELHVN